MRRRKKTHRQRIFLWYCQLHKMHGIKCLFSKEHTAYRAMQKLSLWAFLLAQELATEKPSTCMNYIWRSSGHIYNQELFGSDCNNNGRWTHCLFASTIYYWPIPCYPTRTHTHTMEYRCAIHVFSSVIYTLWIMSVHRAVWWMWSYPLCSAGQKRTNITITVSIQ